MTSREYWKKRALLLEALLHERSEETLLLLARLYDLAQEELVRQIERIFQRYCKGGALTQEQALRLLTVRETEELRSELEEMLQTAEGQAKREIWARLAAPAYANRISRLQALRDRLYCQCLMLGVTEARYVRDRLADTLEQSYYRTIFDAQKQAGGVWDFERLGSNQITAALATEWSGKNWSERLWNNNRKFARDVQETVTVGIMTGQTYPEMRDKLLHTVGTEVNEGAKYNAARLVKTECAYVANQGHLMGYQQAGIETYIYLATLDLRTSEICRSLDMKKFPVADAQAGTNLPPMHPHCRSTTMPDTDADILQKLNRFARDPVTGEAISVPGDMTYQQWYHKYVSGNPDALAAETAVQNRAKDRRQFREYHAVLGKEMPQSVDAFQKMKYTEPERWDALKAKMREAKAVNRTGKGTGNKASHPGVPEQIGVVDFSDKKAVMDQLNDAEQSCFNLPYEVNTTVTTDGKVWRVNGESATVNPISIPSSLQGSYSYHNHPEGSTLYSFSALDVEFFCSSGEAFSKASDRLFEYTMRRTENTVVKPQGWVYDRFNSILRSEDVMGRAFVDDLDMDLDGYHEAMIILSKELGFEYERKEKNQ